MGSSPALYFRQAAVLAAIGLLLSACGSFGDTESIKAANEYAVDCQPDKALAALDRAQQGGGLSSYLAELEKIVVLQDAGRTREASAALQSYYTDHGEAGDNHEDTEKSINDSLTQLRDQRLKKTGQKTCP